jgi:hypothetical protein
LIIPTETSSSGSPRQGHYVAILPFVLAPGAELSCHGGEITTNDGSFTYKLKKYTDVYVVSLRAFDSVHVAAAYLDKLRAILLWLSLTRKVGLSYARGLGEVNLYDVPITNFQHGSLRHIASFHGGDRIVGDYNLDVREALVIPQEKNLLRLQGFAPSVIVGISPVDFFKAINEALAFAQPERVVHDNKLKLSIEIYAGHRLDSNSNSKFISLWTALECLILDVEISERSQEVLNRAKNIVEEERDSHAIDSQEWRGIDALLSRIGNLKTESIRTGLKNYASKHVSFVVSKCPELNTQRQVFTQLDKAYNVRNRLVHDGHVSKKQQFEESFSFLNKFVPLLLEASYREAAGLGA